jgi:proteasome lid subunit RPN8/RPN11
MGSDLIVTVEQLDRITSHIESCLPEEACGLIGGIERTARLVIPVENELHSPVRFTMAPLAQLKGLDLIEAQGWELLAIFHSHPQGPAEPSPTDIAEFYYPGSAVIIASPLGRGEIPDRSAGGLAWGKWRINAFVIENGRVRAVKLALAT